MSASAATAEDETPESRLGVDPDLLDAVTRGTRIGLEMTEVVPEVVGGSRLSQSRHPFSVLVGLVGKNSGTLSFNVSQPAMLFLAGRLMGEESKELNEDAIDAIMEIGNIIAGGVKESLQNSAFKISHASLPSLIFGSNYSMHVSRGITTASAEFEIPDLPFTALDDRFFTTTLSLMHRSGGA